MGSPILSQTAGFPSISRLNNINFYIYIYIHTTLMNSLISSKSFLGGIFGGFIYNMASSTGRDNFPFQFRCILYLFLA